MTGAAYNFKGATISLTGEILSSPKKVTIVRHGLSSWNEESRVQVGTMLAFVGIDHAFLVYITNT